jgi:hypothetical protein
MEQIKIIFEAAVNGFLLTFVAYCCFLSKTELIKLMKWLMERISIFGNIVYKSFAAACVIMSGILILFGIGGYITYSETKNFVASFLVLGLILLIFSYSFVLPKKNLFIKLL